jgi:3,4-dihydroxy 2-butanone 4-phosphate synthase/GTP cyclohydrolase II
MISPTEDIIAEARAGRMFILVDDESRENEGDIIIPAERAAPAHIAFMAKQASGLICLALDGAIVDRLGLKPVGAGETRFGTAFVTPIGARTGMTTGISAADRARTVAAAIADGASPFDIVTPGHVFPLRARDGGVLERAGHTEAAVDIARLAGFKPAAVLCEVMNENGSMARLPDLTVFAQRHGLKIGTVADLIKYRRSEAA